MEAVTDIFPPVLARMVPPVCMCVAQEQSPRLVFLGSILL